MLCLLFYKSPATFCYYALLYQMFDDLIENAVDKHFGIICAVVF